MGSNPTPSANCEAGRHELERAGHLPDSVGFELSPTRPRSPKAIALNIGGPIEIQILLGSNIVPLGPRAAKQIATNWGLAATASSNVVPRRPR